MTRIDDADDPRLADFRDLTTADRRPDRPGGRGLVLAEGAVVVERLVASPYPVRAVLGVRRKLDELAPLLAGVDVPAYEVTADLMATVVGFHLNRGVLASADRAAAVPASTLLANARLVAVLEGINDHENLGSIFRNAAALGVDAVLLGPRCADPLYRRSVRVSMGHVLRVPFAYLPEWPADPGTLRGFHTVALTPGPASGVGSVVGSVGPDPGGGPGPGAGAGVGPGSVVGSGAGVDTGAGGGPSPGVGAVVDPDSDSDFGVGVGVGIGGPSGSVAGVVPLSLAGLASLPRVALLLGAEGPGLSPEALAAADVRVAIPMADGVDSLNVATAAAIAFHAAARLTPPTANGSASAVPGPVGGASSA